MDRGSAKRAQKAKMVKEMGKKVERLWREGSFKLVHRVYEERKGLRKIERGEGSVADGRGGGDCLNLEQEAESEYASNSKQQTATVTVRTV